MIILYLLIILFATTSGAICGMGGGVIIKPLLDATSSYSTFQINLISSLCVLFMALSSLIKHIISKREILIKSVVFASFGALLGGVIGEFAFDGIKSLASSLASRSESIIKIVQNSILAFLLIFVLIYMLKRKQSDGYKESRSKIIKVFCCCIILGIISTFLGIGGGPINVCALCIVMKADTKEVTPYSLFTVFFAQVAKMIKLSITGGFINEVVFDNSYTWYTMLLMIVVAIGGGLLGAIINKKLSNRSVTRLYYIVIVLVISLNIYNIIYNSTLLNIY